MRVAIAGVVLLGFASLAQAQQPLAPPPLTLKVTTDEAMLIVQTLGALGCRNVTEMMTCQQAVALLRSLREQVQAQQK